MSFMADLQDAIHGFHFADRRLSQLPTPQAALVTITEPDSAVSAFEASSAINCRENEWRPKKKASSG